MKRLIPIFIFIIVLSSPCFGDLFGPSRIYVTNTIQGVDQWWIKNNACMQGGNCTLSNLNVINNINATNITTEYYNVTGSINLGGSAISDWSEINFSFSGVHSDLSNLAWSAAGHIIDTNIDMNDHLLSDMSTLALSGGSYIADFDGTLNSASHFSPYSTLDYNLGSGAERWGWLYVQNISAENMDIFNIWGYGNIITESTGNEMLDLNITDHLEIGSIWSNNTHTCYDYPTKAHCTYWNGTYLITT